MDANSHCLGQNPCVTIFLMDSTELKEFYSNFHDQMITKRMHSPYPVRRAVHHDIFASILKHVTPRESILDAGRGEGMLTELMRQKQAAVTGINISTANIESAKTNFRL